MDGLTFTLRYYYGSMPHQVTNHELKLYQVLFDTLKGLRQVFHLERINNDEYQVIRNINLCLHA